MVEGEGRAFLGVAGAAASLIQLKLAATFPPFYFAFSLFCSFCYSGLAVMPASVAIEAAAAVSSLPSSFQAPPSVLLVSFSLSLSLSP